MSILIALHVLIAISSLAYATFIIISPSKAKLKLSYGLIGGTFLTGILLIAALPSHILSVCETGLAYLAVALADTAIARYRLVTSKSK